MIKRIILKSLITLRHEGVYVLIAKIFTYLDKRFRPDKYFHKIRFSSKRKYLLFISGEEKNSTSYYRCEIPLKQLAKNGYDADIVYYKFFSSDILKNYKHIIWYRLPLSLELQREIEKIKRLKRKVIFSIDDLLFDLDSIKSQSWLYRMYPDDREKFLNNVLDIKKFIKKSDLVIVTTDQLAHEINKIIKAPVLIHRNGYSSNELSIADKYYHMWPGIFNIGFFSGSQTHDDDLQIIATVIARLFDEYSQLKLHLGGRINLPNSLIPFIGRVITYPYSCLEKYYQTLAKCSIILAPLVMNLHNQCKSEVRVIQAALVRRIVVASNTSAFRYAVKNNKTGYIIYKNDDWYDIIRHCLVNEIHTKKMGQLAYERIKADYNPKQLGTQLINFLEKYDK